MKKIETEYLKEYGEVPKDENQRFSQLLHELNLTKKARENLFPHIEQNLHMEWEDINFTIYLLPKATPRPRHNSLQKLFYVKGAKDNREIFERFMANQDLPMIITPCKFSCNSYFPIPSSMNNEEKILAEMGLIRPISKPDWDNVAKAYSDMIQGTLLFDDSLIIEGTSRKFYSTKPRIEICLSYMKDFDSLYNEKKIRKKVD